MTEAQNSKTVCSKLAYTLLLLSNAGICIIIIIIIIIHGRHTYDREKPDVDETASNAWLKAGELSP
jgi:hypothetical protein